MKILFSLAANLKKLSILKSSDMDKEYKTLLFKIVHKWPNNKFVLYRLASYYKSNDNYQMSLNIYKKILDHYGSNDHDLFLYASNLDKIGKWKEARSFIFRTFEKKPKRYFYIKLPFL